MIGMDQGPRRRGLRALLILAVVAALVAGTMVVLFSRRHDSDASDVPGGTATTPAGQNADSTASPSATVAGDGRLRLVRGTRTVNGVLVGFPHSLIGAMSAAVEYTTAIGSTLDVDRATAIGRAVGEAGDGDPGAIFAQGPVNNRAGLGLPTTGPVPAGASMTLVPMAVQVPGAHADQATVLTLGYLDSTTPGTATVTRIGVFPLLLVWVDQATTLGGDWRIRQRPADAPDYAALRLDPGSAAATAAGWLAFTR